MTSNTYPYEEDWGEEDWPPAISWEPNAGHGSFPVELAIILATLVVAVILIWGALSLIGMPAEIAVDRPESEFDEDSEPLLTEPVMPLLSDPAAIISPYDLYIVTQGIHGLSYGHMAVDIAAGKGEPIKSPISGVVSENYFDAIGNPTLVIENDRYAVTLLHGIYAVEVGDQVKIGDKIGVESNIGNTRDMQGNSCRNRDCGYHTHLNIFDKIAGSNVNPMNLFGQ